uniref:Adiponectin receptor protein (inferred by orthology to a D. melanogaster protein) n=1 Tax=Strongyloides venezuelensis TaxID=75913 RepID=A0A0K0FHU8_STRVS
MSDCNNIKLQQIIPSECDTLLEESHMDESDKIRNNSQGNLPIDIVVETITAAVNLPDSDEEDEVITIKALNYQLGKKGFKVTEQENGADLEITTKLDETDNNDDGGRKKKSIVMFKKGHRRAWSMPYNNKEKNIVAVVNNDEYAIDDKNKKHIIRYRLHPKKEDGSKQNINSSIELKNVPILKDLDVPPTENLVEELNVDLDENEVLCYTEEEVGKTKTRTVIRKLWEPKWTTQNFELLPEWLQDNEYLKTGHRPPLSSFSACLKSIFALHTETGNIWTHMYGCVIFIGISLWFLTRPEAVVPPMEKVIFSAFFLGAITCLGLSFTFHTVACHSDAVGKLFSKLDYTGISLLIIGSFIPWIYYSFYCRKLPTIVYISMITILGISAIIVSLWDKFAEPAFRSIRAGVFVAMGLSSVFPVIHLLITDGFWRLINGSSFQWLILMGFFYLLGATLYATRTPERFFPGKCDIWFQSHQLFHLFVNVAAFVHFYGIIRTASHFLEEGSCREQLMEQFGPSYEINSVDRFFGIL